MKTWACVIALATIRVSLAAAEIDRSHPCWRDYPPMPMTDFTYESAFAGKTLAPDRITVKGQVLKEGLSEQQIEKLLGLESVGFSDWIRRDAQAQCEYLMSVLRDHPNSMHLYILNGIRDRKLSGEFRTVDWTLSGAGIVRAFQRKGDDSVDRVYLYHFIPKAVPVTDVKREAGEGNVLIRQGPPRLRWDIDKNRLEID